MDLLLSNHYWKYQWEQQWEQQRPKVVFIVQKDDLSSGK